MRFFHKKVTESVALIDIDAASVGTALVVLSEGELPLFVYTQRTPIEVREHEEPLAAMLRTVGEASDALIVKGSPALHQQKGSGHVHRIVASVGAPWQKTQIRVETTSKPKPFVFTHAVLDDMVRSRTEILAGYEKYDESVVATLLNGYDIKHPFGKHTLRADVIVLSSLLLKTAAEEIQKKLRTVYHTHALTLTAFAPVAYKTFRDLFVHEKDFLVMHVSAESTDIAFMKQGMLVDTISGESGLGALAQHAPGKSAVGNVIDTARAAYSGTAARDAEQIWLNMVGNSLRLLAEHHPLPRTIFVLTDPSARDYLSKLLNSLELRSLWLTDEPLRIVSIQPSHIAPFIRVRGDAENDLPLSMLALYASRTNSIAGQ